MADFIFGQLRDISAISGLFAVDIFRNELTPKRSRLMWILLRPNFLAMVFIGIEFFQVHLIQTVLSRNVPVDMYDLFTFSIVPISTAIYYTYVYRSTLKSWLKNLLGRGRALGQFATNFFISFWSPSRSLEFASSLAMIWFELRTNIAMFPSKGLYKAMHLNFSLPTDPFWSVVVPALGDMLEVSVFFMGFRILLALANEFLKKVLNLKPVSDEFCFWISLLTSVVFFSLHAIGFIIFGSPGGTKDYSSNPHYLALIGEGFAAIVLTGAHYLGLYLTKINFKDLVIKLLTKIFSP